MDKNKYFQEWSNKLSMSVEDIGKEFDSILSEEKKENPNLKPEEQELLSLKKLSLIYKKRLRSPAVGFEGIVIGAEEPRDLVAKKRKTAIDMFKNDPQSAILQGVTNEEGVPLDNIEVFSSGRKNHGYGKPLPENSYVRRVFGVAYKLTEKEPKFFTINLNGKACEKNIPLTKPVKFMAIDRSEKGDDSFTLNASSYTEFKVDENIKLPETKKLIEEYIPIAKITELQEYHDLNKEDYNRVVGVKGTISILNLEPTSIGNYIMQIEDESDILDIDAKSITCWIPGDFEINFSEGDEVIVIGRTNQGKLKDDQGNLTEELGDITINVFGMLPINSSNIPVVEEIKEV